MVFFLPIIAVVVVAGGVGVVSQPLRAELERWYDGYWTGQSPTGPVLPAREAAPLRVPTAGGPPLWLEQRDGPLEDAKLIAALQPNEELDNPAKKPSHWTVRPGGDADNTRGDGGG